MGVKGGRGEKGDGGIDKKEDLKGAGDILRELRILGSDRVGRAFDKITAYPWKCVLLHCEHKKNFKSEGNRNRGVLVRKGLQKMGTDRDVCFLLLRRACLL